MCRAFFFFFFFKQKTAYEMRISDWSSDVCSSDLRISHSIEETANDPRLCPARLAPALKFTMETRPGMLTFQTNWQPSGRSRWPARSPPARDGQRSEERRVGKECVSPCSSRWAA